MLEKQARQHVDWAAQMPRQERVLRSINELLFGKNARLSGSSDDVVEDAGKHRRSSKGGGGGDDDAAASASKPERTTSRRRSERAREPRPSRTRGRSHDETPTLSERAAEDAPGPLSLDVKEDQELAAMIETVDSLIKQPSQVAAAAAAAMESADGVEEEKHA